ncbi:aromatic ring-hydroxylating dioxygenase subunit alpha [Tumidithrix elongata RA019]|uniref:Aromatic ring-hydroxylating dioxygenase subunit alpha n=1 Tax=Tumidithrix elongata BACA0141 TaxID=2716417 RepID=A0AAW9PXU9_9CYAN|nr:aromatic ring-hydroxylating dioxygenase subunit alpha [Tumidithrix elongata RA019]
MFQNFWYAVEFSNLITHKPKRIEVLGEELVIYRTDGDKIVALRDRCVHRGSTLSNGWLDRGCIVCPYHGWQYQADGTCVKIPANPPNLGIPLKAKVKAYPVQEKYGWVWVFMGDPQRLQQTSIPELEHLNDPTLARIEGDFHWSANYERVLENSLDIAHAPFVHAGAFGNRDEPEVENYQVEILENEFCEIGASATVFLKPSPPRGLWKYLVGKNSAKVRTRTAFFMPNISLLEVNLGLGRLVIYTSHVPIDAHTTVSKWISLRSFFTGTWANGDARKRVLKIFNQDKPIVESQRPQIVPFDIGAELHVQSDALQLQYRKIRDRYLKLNE